MSNPHDMMRKYADIVNERKINENIEDGILDIVQDRLAKTMGMIEDLMMDIKDEAPETVAKLDELLTHLQMAHQGIAPIRSDFDSMGDVADFDADMTSGYPGDNPEMDATDPMSYPADDDPLMGGQY